MTTTLYDITADMAELLRLHAEGEIDDQTLADTLDAGLKDDEAAKLESYAFAVKHTELDADMIDAQAKVLKEESDRLAARAKAKRNTAARMKERVCAHLVSTGQTKAKAGLFSWSLRSSTYTHVEKFLSEPGRLPFEMLSSVTPSKTEIKKFIEGGGVIEGAYIEERQSVVLK